jgi:hypothetical protein
MLPLLLSQSSALNARLLYQMCTYNNNCKVQKSPSWRSTCFFFFKQLSSFIFPESGYLCIFCIFRVHSSLNRTLFNVRKSSLYRHNEQLLPFFLLTYLQLKNYIPGYEKNDSSGNLTDKNTKEPRNTTEPILRHKQRVTTILNHFADQSPVDAFLA